MSQMTLPGPLKPIHLTVHQTIYHPPVIFITIEDTIHVLSPIHFKSRETPPPFPIDTEDSELVLSTATQNMSINEQTAAEDNARSDSDDWWRIVAEKGGKKAQCLQACAVGEDGDLLVAVGENEEVWVWRNKS